MDPTATSRDELLRIASETLAELQASGGEELVARAASTENVATDLVRSQRDVVVNTLAAALDFARLEEDLLVSDKKSVAESVHNIPYIPSNQALCLIQSAIEEFHEQQPATTTEEAFDTSDPGWLTVAWEKLKALVRGKHPFLNHQGNLTAFREQLPDNAVVALFSDWGTGEATAQRVMSEITQRTPTHAIHLGDVYYSGTEKEVQRRFLDVIDTHGPAVGPCRYLALNSNHEMYSGGHAYFRKTLPRFNQQASYFNLRNEHWQLIGLDSGYEDHGLQDPQNEWLAAQLMGSATRNILLTHHQLFSPFEKRAQDRKLAQKVSPLLPNVFAWFWGHEHKAIIFGDHLGIKARCIGHGAIPADVPYGDPTSPVPIVAIDQRGIPNAKNDAIHGFALLTFAGPTLSVEYIDEFGTTWFNEQLQS